MDKEIKILKQLIKMVNKRYKNAFDYKQESKTYNDGYGDAIREIKEFIHTLKN